MRLRITAIITNRAALKHPDIEYLKIIQYIFKKNHLPLRIYLLQSSFNKAVREELSEILVKYWHSSRFRDLSFYFDPDIGKQKTIISQGEIIEEIISICEDANSAKGSKDYFLTAPTGSGKSLPFPITSNIPS